MFSCITTTTKVGSPRLVHLLKNVIRSQAPSILLLCNIEGEIYFSWDFLNLGHKMIAAAPDITYVLL